MAKVEAQAHPEKRLFISLLTRDISLVDAFLDLLDNSINAALGKSGIDITDPATYVNLSTQSKRPAYRIDITYSKARVEVADNCGGISAHDAQNDIFVFGSGEDGDHVGDSLSVYGIGLKRALFKFGSKVLMTSNHAQGGFSLNLDVPAWERKKQDRWTFPIETLPPSAPKKTGTSIVVTDLHPAVAERLQNTTFESELLARLSRAYSFFLHKVVDIYVNREMIQSDEPNIGQYQAVDNLTIGDVSIYIVAGIGVAENKRFTSERAGWTVYCNGRAVLYYEKSPLTGWGVPGYLPTFQPKHRPFVGMVFFASRDPSHLPWTTTKLGVNPDNHVWQRTLRKMADVGRQVTKFLDERYGEEGTTMSSDELTEAVGTPQRVYPTARSATAFTPPKKAQPTTTSIQFSVERKLLGRVKAAIGEKSMSNSEVGRYTFDYFVENEMS